MPAKGKEGENALRAQKATEDPVEARLATNSPGPDPTAKTHYDEVQQEEIEVLRGIYQDDFVEHAAANTAWHRSDPAFEIRLKAQDNPDFALTLGVRFTPTYPKSLPVLSLKNHSTLDSTILDRIRHFIDRESKSLIRKDDNVPIIFDITSSILDILNESVSMERVQGADGQVLPSLDEERAAREAENLKQAEMERLEAERKKEKEQAEEQRALQESLDQETQRQREKMQDNKKRNKSIMIPRVSEESVEDQANKIVFDQPCKIEDASGNEAYFSAVTSQSEYRRGLIATTYTVRPIVVNAQNYPALVMKVFHLRPDPEKASEFKKQLDGLEGKLNEIKGIRHPNILELMEFRIDREAGADPSSLDRCVRVLTPLADRGPLEELLEITGGQIAITKIRSWTTDLLSALGFLHGQGLVHEDIHPGNILLFRDASGHVLPKLADARYQRELHGICRHCRTISTLNSARSTYWLPPEIAGNTGMVDTKTDIWDFGVVFLQMIFGRDVYEKFPSPDGLMSTLTLSPSLRELVTRFFKSDPKRRSRAFDLRSSEFLVTDAPILIPDEIPNPLTPAQSFSSAPQVFRKRLESTVEAPTYFRYRNEYEEEGRLGKGGFGEVVKARRKIDGRIYAIKKIVRRGHRTMSQAVMEVQTLAQLSHPAIVRYHDAWIEKIPDVPGEATENDSEGDSDDDSDDSDTDSDDDDEDDDPKEKTCGHRKYKDSDEGNSSSTDNTATQDGNQSDSQGQASALNTSTRGHDFMSTNFDIEFADDSEGAADDDDSEDASANDEDGDSGGQDRPLSIRRAQSHTPKQPYKNVLYISMEYCEKKTLRDLIAQELYKDTEEVWRLFRQILEGLVHIHSLHNLVHRDLKPENIFITRGNDQITNVKIGDFGLATSGYGAHVEGAAPSLDVAEMSVAGTAAYMAPEMSEVQRRIEPKKMDMYSLGIMFFEMCYRPISGHERVEVLSALRAKSPKLPADFKPVDKAQRDIILSLVTHNPLERPTSTELLRDDKFKMPMEEEVLQRALAEASDPSSTHHQKLINALFLQPTNRTKDYTWEKAKSNSTASYRTANEFMYQGIVKSELVSVFRRHGAVEIDINALYPRSEHYGADVVQLLDQYGNNVQLPYDLVLGHARVLAKQASGPLVPKSFSFGNIFRDKKSGGQPIKLSEVVFDIVSRDALDLALKEAEVIKVLDEIVMAFPSLSKMCFHINHSDLLQLIFNFCGVSQSARKATAEALSRLHAQTWQQVRVELRKAGLSVSTIDELEKFNFRETPTKAFAKLKSLFEGGVVMPEKAQPTVAHLKEVVSFAKRFGVRNRVYISPLGSLRENFYKGGILFQCVYDRKLKEVFAAGGRYDSLILEHRPNVGYQADQRHAVGFSFALEKLAQPPKPTGKGSKKGDAETPLSIFNTKRCDVLVASFDNSILRTTGVEVLQNLWTNNITAELAYDARSVEDLFSKHRDETYSWIVIIKQDDIVKIRTVGRKDVPDVETPSDQLVSWLHAELRERDRQLLPAGRHPHHHQESAHHHHHHAAGPASSSDINADQEVRVLMGNTKSKKSNRRNIVEQAQMQAAALVQGFRKGPIAAVETSDMVLEIIRDTKLSDADSWRRAEQKVSSSERNYIREIQDMLVVWRGEREEGGAEEDAPGRHGHAFVYNFRTTKCIYYDLSA